jgi:hypothetical protein
MRKANKFIFVINIKIIGEQIVDKWCNVRLRIMACIKYVILLIELNESAKSGPEVFV